MSPIALTNLSKGFQVTLPSKFRKALGLEKNDPIQMSLQGNSIVITKSQTLEEQIDEMFATFDAINAESDKHLTPEQREFNKKTAGWTVNQYHEYFDNLPETKAYIKEKYGI